MIKLILSIILLLMTLSVSANDLVLVVHKDNPVNSLTKSQVIDIYMGRFITFPDGKAVQPIDLETDYKNQFYKDLVNQSERKINAYWSRLLFSGRAKPPTKFSSVEEVLAELAELEIGIAYIPVYAVNDSVKVVFRLE